MGVYLETPEDIVKFQLGAAIADGVALRAEVERLRRELAEKNAPDIDDPSQPDLA